MTVGNFLNKSTAGEEDETGDLESREDCLNRRGRFPRHDVRREESAVREKGDLVILDLQLLHVGWWHGLQ